MNKRVAAKHAAETVLRQEIELAKRRAEERIRSRIEALGISRPDGIDSGWGRNYVPLRSSGLSSCSHVPLRGTGELGEVWQRLANDLGDAPQGMNFGSGRNVPSSRR